MKQSKKTTKKTASPSGGPDTRMRELEKEIRRHQKLYYEENKPVISDRSFDALLKELEDLEKENPSLTSADSPTKSVGSDLDNEFPKFRHTIPVMSLSNTYSNDEAMEWAAKTAPDEKTRFDVQWKVDGATLVLYYEKGTLIRAVTRGSGQVGDEVTANAMTIRSVPKTLAEKVDVAVRGEVYMTYEDFQRFNDEVGSIYANPRNLSAGSLKHKKSRETARRPLRWTAFDAFFGANTPETDEKTLRYLAKLGLPVFEENVCVPLKDLAETLADFTGRKDSRNFPVDGLVLKIDDRALRERLGYTSSAPRWAVALKFEPEIAETVVKKIETFVGRTGRVTPRAELEPVKLAGTTVTFATLHNADFISNLDVRIGSRVKVSKRGEIIPAVEEVVDKGPGPAYQFPEKCPECGSGLVREEDAVDWMCPNPFCDEKIISGIIFFCQRQQMDINGMGDKIVRTLYKNKYIKSIEDIYGLARFRADLEKMEGFGEKSVQVILDGIEKSKEKDFRYVLPSLGLKEIGPNVTELLLSEGYDSIEKIIKLAKSKNAQEILSGIKGIGPNTAKAVIAQFQEKRTLEMISALKKAGLKFKAMKADTSGVEQVFAGQTWCVTGSFEKFKPRELAMEEVKKRGGKVVTSVSAKTSHLLAGEGGGSKLENAEKYGTKIVSEAEFLKMIG